REIGKYGDRRNVPQILLPIWESLKSILDTSPDLGITKVDSELAGVCAPHPVCYLRAMARLPRVVIVDVPHHVTQRGNARQVILGSDADRIVYLELLREYSQ